MHQLLTQRQRLARPVSPRQPISGHPGRVRVRKCAAKEDHIVPGQGAFRTRDELVHSSFSTAQAESLTKLFPAGSALAKVFEDQELKEKEKAQELKEKERDDAWKKKWEEVKQRLDILSLAVGILVFLLLAQSLGISGALNTVFKSVLRI